MNECVARTKLPSGAVRIPISYLICNQASPVGDKPSLMNLREVTTLFHEAGHVTQSIFTTVDYSMAAGIRNVEWDAVELPSQFTENFCYHKETLKAFSEHIDTKEPISDELYDKIIAAKNYRAASDQLRQLQFGMVDMALHSKLDISDTETAESLIPKIYGLEAQLQKLVMVMPPIPGQKFLNGFSHIFGGGYAAGYYSYKWAECMSADAFEAFEEVDFANNPENMKKIGRKFRDTILAMGGTKGAAQVYREFRGRDPSTQALLKQLGLLKKKE